MRRKSGLIVPNDIEEAAPPASRSGCQKRRLRSRVDTHHCVCGLKLKTRRGEARCPKHGTAWAAEHWELTKVTVD